MAGGVHTYATRRPPYRHACLPDGHTGSPTHSARGRAYCVARRAHGADRRLAGGAAGRHGGVRRSAGQHRHGFAHGTDWRAARCAAGRLLRARRHHRAGLLHRADRVSRRMNRDSAQVVVRPSAARTAVPDWRAVLQQAMQAHQAEDLDTAERLYREVLDLRVAQPDALHYLGVLCHQCGRSDEGVELIRTALQVTPKHPDAHNNLGNIHKECGRLCEAEACYRKALECGPQHHNALSNLAVVLEAQERPQEAFEAYEKLLRQAPRYAQGHYLLGLFLRNHAQNLEHIEQSVARFREAYALEPRFVQALEALSVSQYVLGRTDEAVQVYRDWVAREPDNPIPRHMLAACGGADAPVRAGDAYVRDIFDRFADSFDEQLLHN